MRDIDKVLRELAWIKMPFIFNSKAINAISDAMILLKLQEAEIKKLKDTINELKS